MLRLFPLYSIFYRSGKNVDITGFFPFSSFSFQKKKRRRRSRRRRYFPISFLFFSFSTSSFSGEKEEKKNSFSLSLSPFGRRYFPVSFSFFREEGERKTPFLFRFFLLFSSLFWRGKMGENGGRNGKGERKKFCLF